MSVQNAPIRQTNLSPSLLQMNNCVAKKWTVQEIFFHHKTAHPIPASTFLNSSILNVSPTYIKPNNLILLIYQWVVVYYKSTSGKNIFFCVAMLYYLFSCLMVLVKATFIVHPQLRRQWSFFSLNHCNCCRKVICPTQQCKVVVQQNSSISYSVTSASAEIQKKLLIVSNNPQNLGSLRINITLQ